jgi:hypothetical protein
MNAVHLSAVIRLPPGCVYIQNKYKNPAMSKIKRFINPETAISKRYASLRRTWCTQGAALEKDFDMSDTS